MEIRCKAHEKHMEILWIPIGHLRKSYGTHGYPQDIPKDFRRISIGFAWDFRMAPYHFHKISMRFPYDSIRFPQDFHRISMRFPKDSICQDKLKYKSNVWTKNMEIVRLKLNEVK